MTSFQIQNTDGTLSTVSHGEFFEILNNEDGFLYYKQGGTHLALLSTALNEETLRCCRQAENAENYNFAANSRCRDNKGHLCRYQHDANGSVIRNADGNPVSAKCGDCPRDGWTAGNRANCCIRNYCKVNDCTYCPHHREYRVPLSLERFLDDDYDGGDAGGAEFGFADPGADILTALENDELNSALHIALNQLPSGERAVLKTIFWGKLSQRAYATESGMSRSVVKRLYDRGLASLKNILKDFS